MENNTGHPTHLCVLIHGMWGNPSHLDYLASCLRTRFEDDIHLLATTQNAGTFTYDGIELGGERATHEIIEELEKFERKSAPIKRLSLIGYSLGGLVARYAIGLLEHKGWLEKVEPVNFTTFATPHLGTRSPRLGYPTQLYNGLGARILSTSGRQLFLIDTFRDTSRPLLSVMTDTDTPFMRGLARFRSRSLYANVINDRSAPYHTAYITATDPYADLSAVEINYAPGYDSVMVDAADPVSRRHEEPSAGALVLSHAKWLPVYGILGIVIPIAASTFLVNSVVQTARSWARIRNHEAGRATFAPDLYRLPLPPSVDRMYTQFGQAGMGEDYLPDGQKGNATLAKGLTKEGKPYFPPLALTQAQFTMIDALDAVGWKKYPVHIQKVRHSHAAIIVRMKTTFRNFDEGNVVVDHWLDRFEL